MSKAAFVSVLALGAGRAAAQSSSSSSAALPSSVGAARSSARGSVVDVFVRLWIGHHRDFQRTLVLQAAVVVPRLHVREAVFVATEPSSCHAEVQAGGTLMLRCVSDNPTPAYRVSVEGTDLVIAERLPGLIEDGLDPPERRGGRELRRVALPPGARVRFHRAFLAHGLPPEHARPQWRSRGSSGP